MRNNTNFPLEVRNSLERVPRDGVLQYHQKLAHHYFITHKQNRGLLLFHATGMGKTMIAAAIADTLKTEYNVIILSAKSLRGNFIKEVKKYSELTGSDTSNYKYVSLNAGNMLDQLGRVSKSKEEIAFEKTLDIVSKTSSLSKVLLIVDEAQNLFNGIVNGSKNATGLYNIIMKSKNIKIVFLSATPIINDPFEIVPMFNMLHGDILLPTDYSDFYMYYIDTKTLQIKNKELLKNRIYGLVSYMGDWWIEQTTDIIKRDHFPDQLPTIIEYIHMSPQQYASYANARDVERQITQQKGNKNSMQRPKGSSSTYRVGSRQLSNFLLPNTLKVKKIGEHGFDKHIDKLTDSHLMHLDIYSPKMDKMLTNIQKHTGTCVVYSSFVTGEGLRIFSKVLQARGWSEYDPSDPSDPSDSSGSDPSDSSSQGEFAFITGDVPMDKRTEIINHFNHISNIDGKNIRMLMISSAGAEGLDLRNVRSIHLMEPYWNYARMVQIIARAVRYKSHDDYKSKEDKTVQPYIYLSDYPVGYTPPSKNPEKTTDVHIYDNSIDAKMLIDRMYNTLIEASIDCSIHVKNAPASVQKKTNCLMCMPTGNPLFQKSYITDLKVNNPCVPPTEQKISVEEIVYLDKTYYYKKDNSGLSIYEFNPSFDAYVELDRSHPHYAHLVDLLY